MILAEPARNAALSAVSLANILVVEDEMLVLMDVEFMLERLGYTSIFIAANVDEALRTIEAQSLDGALLDLNLSGERSYPVADALAAAGVPFAFTTGYGASGIRKTDVDRPVLTKPYRLADLSKTLNNVLGYR